MKSINQVTILGNLTKDPEMRFTPKGSAVINFSVATNRQWTIKETGERKEAADFHDIVFWEKAAEIINQYVRKGSKILVQGRLQTRSWEGKDGVKRYKTEIIGSDFVLLDRKPDGASEAPSVASQVSTPTPPSSGKEVKINPNDIPF
jgi:single-strand DNA-binding protein